MEPGSPAKPDWLLQLPGRTVLLRTERPDDAAFLKTLFHAVAAPLPGIDPAMAEDLLDMQFRSQSRSYRATYPGAWFAVMTMAGEPFGRLVLDQGMPSHIVDYALLPAVRGQGLGTAVLAALLQRVGGPVHNTVLCTNAASLAMCRRVGFAVVADRGLHLEMEWRPGCPRRRDDTTPD